jgi:hypothetical protein
MTSGGTDQNDRDVTFTRLDILDADALHLVRRLVPCG